MPSTLFHGDLGFTNNPKELARITQAEVEAKAKGWGLLTETHGDVVTVICPTGDWFYRSKIKK